MNKLECWNFSIKFLGPIATLNNVQILFKRHVSYTPFISTKIKMSQVLALYYIACCDLNKKSSSCNIKWYYWMNSNNKNILQTNFQPWIVFIRAFKVYKSSSLDAKLTWALNSPHYLHCKDASIADNSTTWKLFPLRVWKSNIKLICK